LIWSRTSKTCALRDNRSW